MTQPTETYRVRLRKYHRRERMTVWVGAGYAGIIALMTTKVFEKATAPSVLNALLVSIIIVGAFCLGKARVGFEWRATVIQRAIQDHSVQEAGPVLSVDSWPKTLDRTWFASLFLLFASGVTAIVTVWWGPVSKLFC